MKQRGRMMACLLIVFFLTSAVAAWAEDIKTRMRDRLPQIVALKAAGVVGENNQGYLTVLKPPTEKQGLIDAENQDRQIIYQEIARQQNTTPELVGQRRALQIAENAEPGAWVQDARGNWRQK